MTDLILIGGGGHAKSCIDVIEQEKKFRIAGIVDLKNRFGHEILGYKIQACDDDIADLVKSYHFFHIAIGQLETPEPRIRLYNLLKGLGAQLPSIVSPRAYVARGASIDEGSIIMHNAVINTEARIGRNCIVNSCSLIEHDAIIEDHCHIATGAIVNGNSRIGENSFVGSGAVIRQGISIPASSFVKAATLSK